MQRCTTVWQLTLYDRNCTTLTQRTTAARWENCQLMEQLIAYCSVMSALGHELLCSTTSTGARTADTYSLDQIDVVAAVFCRHEIENCKRNKTNKK